jgi:hypothetical protein
MADGPGSVISVIKPVDFECEIGFTFFNSGRFFFSRDLLISNDGFIGCPISGVAQRAMREAAPHARGVNKGRQL